MATTSHMAMPARVTPSPTPSKRGHARSASLENANSFLSKNTLGLPIVQAGNTGTLKSRNEQKRMRNKFGSHSNLEDFVQQGRAKFQNIRQMFELTKRNQNMLKSSSSNTESREGQSPMMPPIMSASYNSALQSASNSNINSNRVPQNIATNNGCNSSNSNNISNNKERHSQSPMIPAVMSGSYHAALQSLSSNCSNRVPNIATNGNVKEREGQSPMMPAIMSASYNSNLQSLHNNNMNNNNSSNRILNHGKNFNEIKTSAANVAATQNTAMRASATSLQNVANSPGISTSFQQQAQPQTRTIQTQQRSASGLSQLQQDAESTDQATNLIRPIAFKPIPFEPDYSISSRYTDVDRYGSTPSLVPVQGSNMRFGSTTDLRHGGSNNIGVGGFIIGNSVGNVYSSNNYCNSLMARRRGSRSLKINDSMESIRHTPDSDANSQTGTIKSSCSNSNNNNNSCNNNLNQLQYHHNGNNSCNNSINNNNNNINISNNNLNSKYTLSEQCDMTPSPSDSGISELEAALKDRDSELSYLRQTMEHNEKDKETFWENELKRLKSFYEGQQREYLLKIKKMEQMLAMQQFQMKQHKLRHTEQTNKLKEQLSDLKNENEILRSNSSSLKSSERNLKDRTAFIEEQLEKSENLISNLKSQLEENEWKVCERNGEIALLKTQLKEANLEITMKEHALVHLKQENTNVESQIYQSLQENHSLTQHQKQIEEQKAQNDQQTETELKQMNKIIILKDQVILALTSELAKLRKELSDLAISHEYGEEPSGKFTRLKQQLDNLTDICQKTRKQAQNSQKQAMADNEDDIVDAANIELIMNCLKLAPANDHSDDEKDSTILKADERLAKMSADIQKFVYGSQNLPDIAINTKPVGQKLEEADLDTLIKESANYAEEIAKLRHQLDNVRVNFELEKQQWCEEKEKVLNYQKQLQSHYINMYQKLKSLENACMEN